MILLYLSQKEQLSHAWIKFPCGWQLFFFFASYMGACPLYPHPTPTTPDNCVFFSRSWGYTLNNEKRELEQYKYFEPNIKALKFMIQQMENEAKMAAYPSNRTIERAKKDIAAYTKEIAEYRQRQLDVVNFINDIQDEDTRKLSVYRFVKGKGWREAARVMVNY